MYLVPAGRQPPRHAAVIFDLGGEEWVFEDVRGFGRMTLDPGVVSGLGPEPLEAGFTEAVLWEALKGSRQAVKVRLLDQSVVAGVGNIYASEALFRARISPRRRAGALGSGEVGRLRDAVVEVLEEAIRLGSALPLDFAGDSGVGGSGEEGLFYYGRMPGGGSSAEERFRVYDRSGLPCVACGTSIRRILQAARSTYFCPRCQR
jgi:formamidopyrimidine-DNA glycosylase